MCARTIEEKAKAKADRIRLKLKHKKEQDELKEALATAHHELQECRLALSAYQRENRHPKSSRLKSSSSSAASTIKNKKCQKGTRKNKKTGECEKYP
jgi:hypothetical protein